MGVNYGKRQVYNSIRGLEILENKPWKMIYVNHFGT